MRCRVVHGAWLFAVGCSAPHAAPDAPPERTWATYLIEAGDHDAQVLDRSPKNPIDGVVSVAGREYELALNSSAMYVLTAPVEPNDQLDWNKLPGLSDCNTLDLSIDGVMVGWRWRPELDLLELTAYANNASVHLTSSAPILTLDRADLASEESLTYRLWRTAGSYEVTIRGSVRGRAISVDASLPRRCAEVEIDPLAWAAGLYFGGTSVAPTEVTAKVREAPYVP